jgi:hypothetical protein
VGILPVISKFFERAINDQLVLYFSKIVLPYLSVFRSGYAVLAVDDRHVAFCENNGSVARIICVAVATLANEKLLERASDNDLLLCRKSTSNKTRYRQ